MVLNGQKSSRKGITSVVPQGLLLFLIYINPIQAFSVCSQMDGGGGGAGVKGPPPKKAPLPKICDTSYNDEVWHSYTLPKEDPKTI